MIVTIITTIFESLFVSLFFVLVKRVLLSHDAKTRFSKLSSGRILIIVFAIFMTGKIIYSQTYYGDCGGGSYKRIPLHKPYQIIHDGDWQYAAIYSSENEKWNPQGKEIIRVVQYQTSGDTLLLGRAPGDEAEHYFSLDMQNGKLSKFEYHAYLRLIRKLGINDDLKDIDWHYSHYWYWYLHW